METGSEASARRRIAITGMGAVSAFGLGAPLLWQAMVDGRSGIGPLRAAAGEKGIRMRVAAAFSDFEASTTSSAPIRRAAIS